jgi:hypothetical protein
MADPKPNPCRTPACCNMRPRPQPIVDSDWHGVSMVQCPECNFAEWGDDRDDAIAQWNAMNPRRRRWPWVLAAAIVLGAFIGGAIGG